MLSCARNLIATFALLASLGIAHAEADGAGSVANQKVHGNHARASASKVTAAASAGGFDAHAPMSAQDLYAFLKNNPDLALARATDPNTLRLFRLYRNWQMANRCAPFMDNAHARLEARREIWEAERRVSGVIRQGCWDKAELLTREPSAESCAIAHQFMAQMAEKSRSARIEEAQAMSLPRLR